MTPTAPGRTDRRYLMCEPVHYTVSYEINPWMDKTKHTDADLAVRQWRTLRDIYLDLGHTVETIDPIPGLPDMVYAANGATVLDGVVYSAQVPLRRAPARGPRVPEVVRRPRLRHAHRRADQRGRGRPARRRRPDPGRHRLPHRPRRARRGSRSCSAARSSRSTWSARTTTTSTPRWPCCRATRPTRRSRTTRRRSRPARAPSCASCSPTPSRPPSATRVALGLNAVSDGYNVVVAPGAVDLAAAHRRARLQPDPGGHQRAAQGRRRRQVLHARDPPRVRLRAMTLAAVVHERRRPRAQLPPAAGHAGRRARVVGHRRRGPALPRPAVRATRR